MQFGNDEYKVWSDGIWRGFLYDHFVNDDEISYTFYSGIKLDASSDDNLLFSTFTKKKGEPITEDDITNGFANAISKSIVSDAKHGKTTFLDSLKALPKNFFTRGNCDLVLENVLQLKKGLSKNETNQIDIACERFLKTANRINPVSAIDFEMDRSRK